MTLASDDELLELFERDGLSYREIAVRHGLSLGSVAGRLFRARNGSRRIRRNVEDDLSNRKLAISNVLLIPDLPPAHIQTLRSWAEGTSYKRIADSVGYSEAWVNMILKKYKVRNRYASFPETRV